MSYRLPTIMALIALAGASPAQAELHPHVSKYSLRLGTAANAPRVGTATQDLTLTCDGWNIQRDVLSDTAFTPSLELKLRSHLTGHENLTGSEFRYSSSVAQNSSEHTKQGNLQRDAGTLRWFTGSAGQKSEKVLPTEALLPTTAVAQLVDKLAAGENSFSVVAFVGDGGGAVLQFDVKTIDLAKLQVTPPAEEHLTGLGNHFWPVGIEVSSIEGGQRKRLASARLQVFDTGVLDRLAVDVGPVTLTAYLKALEMHGTPDCRHQ